jgi:plastocyanin
MKLAAASAALVLLCAGVAQGKTYKVAARGVTFDPKTLEVKRGDTVEWSNVDVVPHNVRQTTQHLFWSKDLQPQAKFRWKANKRGTWPYFCSLHPEMTGTITVK